MAEVLNLPLQIQNEAWEAINAIIQMKNISVDYALRVGIKGSGCSGQFLLGFDLPKSTDEIFYYKNLKICIDKSHLLYLFGLEIRYEEDEDGQMGFAFLKVNF